jgi:hypothetical protein
MTADPVPDPERTEVDLFGNATHPYQPPRWPPAQPADLYADLRSAVQGHRRVDEAESRQRKNRSERPPGQHAKDQSPAAVARRTRRRRVIPRGLHKFWAELRGKFWTPCPQCGEYFGGHEWTTRREDKGGHIATLWAPPDEPRRAICPACTRAGVGCLSHARHGGHRHPRCPYLFALE